MERTPITPDLSQFPGAFHTLLENTPVFDSSCSKAARVWYLDREGGLFLKAAPKGALKTEADMTAFFHRKGLGAEVLHYLSGERDWMLTRCLPGEDCTHPAYTSDPKRLCDTTATLLRQLHETDISGCPVQNRNELYLRTAQEGYLAGNFEPELFSQHWKFSDRAEAWSEIEKNRIFLKPDVLLHGDYCLPNIMLQNWGFSGFLDLGNGGIGDRHIDLLWSLWTLFFNLHTHHYADRFLDVYGREAVQKDFLRTIAALEVFR